MDGVYVCVCVCVCTVNPKTLYQDNKESVIVLKHLQVILSAIKK